MDKRFFEILLQAIGVVVCVLLAAICNAQAHHFAARPDAELVWTVMSMAFMAVAVLLVYVLFNSNDEDDLP